jgi:type VI secretion system protein ImpK
MREEFAAPVYAVFRAGLDLKERLEKNPELLDMYKEQSNLKEIVRKVPNFGEDKSHGDEVFLGIRYPLVSWLDEIFILDSSWSADWKEATLEVGFFDTRDRAWKFWDQADLAESRVSIDALEIFFLCVTLGFRGDKHDSPEKVQSWFKTTKALLLENQGRRWPSPDEVQPTTFVPPLTGEERKQSMILAWAVSVLLIIPVAVIYIINRLTG